MTILATVPVSDKQVLEEMFPPASGVMKVDHVTEEESRDDGCCHGMLKV